MKRTLASLFICMALASCASVSAVEDRAETFGRPFTHLSVCDKEWSGLINEWLESPVGQSRSYEEIATRAKTDSTSRINKALRVTWSSNAGQEYSAQDFSMARKNFLVALSPHLSSECYSVEWMVEYFSNRGVGLPLGAQLPSDARQVSGEDYERAQAFVRQLLLLVSEKQTK